MNYNQQSKVYLFNLRNSNHTLDLADNIKWLREINSELDSFRLDDLAKSTFSVEDMRRIDELERQLRGANKRNRELKKELTEIEREYKQISDS